MLTIGQGRFPHPALSVSLRKVEFRVVNRLEESSMQKNRMFAGGGVVAALLVGATMWLSPAAALPTVTVYKSPT